MFDWSKNDVEMRKRNNKKVLLFFFMWVIYTSLFGVALAQLSSMLYISIGFAAYAMSCVGFKLMGNYFKAKELFFNQYKLLKECVEQFVKDKHLEKEFNEFSGSSL